LSSGVGSRQHLFVQHMLDLPGSLVLN
jgi:hypothetical protein